MKTVEQLQEVVNQGVVIQNHEDTYFALQVEENGDEFEITRNKDLEALEAELKNNGLIQE